MNPARRVSEKTLMTASRTSRRTPRRAARARKTVPRRTAKPVLKIGSKLAPAPQVLFRLCRSSWSVIVEKIPNAAGTRFVCPFCTTSHKVQGPVRGFRKIRRPQWIKLRRVEE
jgi:hypothetical protein